MNLKRIFIFFPYLLRLPTSVSSQVVTYFVKRLLRIKTNNHEIIWTSFFYFTLEEKVIIQETADAYKVEFILNNARQTAYIRKGISSDIFVFFQVFISREYQSLIDFLLQKQLTPQTIIDAGANVGYFSLLFHGLLDKAKITVIEPDEKNVGLLEKNLSEMGDQLSIVRAALWTRKCELQLVQEGAREWAFSVKELEADATLTCKAVSLSDVMASASTKSIDLLKLDVEGAEEVLFNNSEFVGLLDHVKVIAMEIHDDRANRKKIHEVLRDHSFEFFEKGELTVAWNTKLVR